MTAADRFDPRDVDRINEVMDDVEEREQRITDFLDAVEHMPGPLGALLRVVGAAHRAFMEAEDANATTVGEYQRLAPIVDAALNTQEWLAGGEQPNPEPEQPPARRRWLFGRKRGRA